LIDNDDINIHDDEFINNNSFTFINEKTNNYAFLSLFLFEKKKKNKKNRVNLA